MAKDNSREAKIKLVFASYPEAKSFHFTSDGNAFSQESDAKNHAKSLEDKSVIEITRAMAKSGEIQTAGNKKYKVATEPNAGAKNEFQAQGTVWEVSLDGEPVEGVPYGKDDQGRTVSDIATDVAEKIQDNVAKATESTVTDSSDAAEAAEKEAESVGKEIASTEPRNDAPAEAPAKAEPAKETKDAPAKKSSSTKKGGK